MFYRNYVTANAGHRLHDDTQTSAIIKYLNAAPSTVKCNINIVWSMTALVAGNVIYFLICWAPLY